MKYHFDQFTIDCDLAQLSLTGEALALEPRVFDLLVFLVENRQRVVSKDEIVERLWAGRFTSDAAISTCVKSLRRVLNDDGDRQLYIKTLRGRGFRFIGELQGHDSAEVLPDNPSIIFTREAGFMQAAASAVQRKPSIIVLPFQNSDEQGQGGIVCEALAHELIQALSRLRWLRVIARGTAFQFRQADVDLRKLGERLQLRYVLCGSIESIGSLYAVTVELNDCHSEDVIWAERFEVHAEQLHEMRQSILASLVAALEMYIPLHEAGLAALKTSDNLDAWSNYHLGLRHMFRFTQGDNQRAAFYFDKAITQDPGFARAYAGKSFTRFQDGFLKYSNDGDAARRDARAFAERSIELDPLDPFTNYNMGRSFWLEDNVLDGMGWLERSVSLSPNFAQGFYSCAFSEVLQGNPERALENSTQAMNLSPLDPLSYAVFSVRALANLRINDMTPAVYWTEKASRAPGAHFLILMITAATFALAGDINRARYWSEQVRNRNPHADLSHFFKAFPFSDQNFRNTMAKGLQLAGF
jgi:TolB-like protein/Tfp pilus assembly protein PilF